MTPEMPIRRDLIRVKIMEIREGVALVRSHLPGTFDEFSRLGLLKDGMYKRTEFAIENVLDICAVLNADLRLGIPGQDEEIIASLHASGILSGEMAKKIRGMKAFRNIVVHRYGAIDDRIAYSLLTTNLPDLDLFCGEIEAFLSSSREERI